jgi:diguanylate cyclase (GGDEF)-like protein/PAS domain S-box-containing protein
MQAWTYRQGDSTMMSELSAVLEGNDSDAMIRLKRIMDGIDAAVAYVDNQFKYRYANRAFCAIYGLSYEAMTRLDVHALLGQSSFREVHNYILQALMGERVYYERLVQCGSGELRWMLVQLTPDRVGDKVLGYFAVMLDIQDRKRTEQVLSNTSNELRRLLDNMPGPICYIDQQFCYRYVNRAFCEWIGLNSDCIQGKTVSEIEGEAIFSKLAPSIRRALSGQAISLERIITYRDGRQHWMYLRYVPDQRSSADIQGVYAIMSDIQALKETEKKLRQVNWLLDSHINNSPLAVTEWTADFRLVRWSPQAERIFGWKSEEVLGRRMSDWNFVFPADIPDLKAELDRVRHTHRHHAVTLTRNHRKDGSIAYCEWYHSCLYNEQGQLVSILSLAQDISSRVEAEERLNYLANHDPLTGLPNRTLLQERLKQALARSKRSGKPLALLFIDLDRFKVVNDTLGHKVGDRLLKLVSETLRDCVRGSDTIARLGGDEFMLLLEDQANRNSAAALANKMLLALTQPFYIDDHEIFIGASIGISFYPDDGQDIDMLTKNADVAMYRAKESGSNSYQFFAEDMAQALQQQVVLERSLRAAIEHNQLSLLFQPRYKLLEHSIEPVALEAFVRWTHPELGLLTPKVFMKVAEDSNLMNELGDWIFEHALQAMKVLRSEYPTLQMAINISSRQLRQAHFVSRLALLCRQYDIPPEALILEIHEATLLCEHALLESLFHKLKELGILIAIDDFGIGYASLIQLKQLPIDILNIDKQFIQNIGQDQGDEAITSATLAIAQQLGMQVMAEGVESQVQLDFLRRQRCSYVQGFFLGEPSSLEQVMVKLRSV